MSVIAGGFLLKNLEPRIHMFFDSCRNHCAQCFAHPSTSGTSFAGVKQLMFRSFRATGQNAAVLIRVVVSGSFAKERNRVGQTGGCDGLHLPDGLPRASRDLPTSLQAVHVRFVCVPPGNLFFCYAFYS